MVVGGTEDANAAETDALLVLPDVPLINLTKAALDEEHVRQDEFVTGTITPKLSTISLITP